MKILVIEDDLNLVATLKDVLESNCYICGWTEEKTHNYKV